MSQTAPQPAISASGLRFVWPGQAAPTLDIPAFSLDAGQSLFLYGPSGCGKSTFLAALAGVLDPGAGRIEIAGIDLSSLGGAKRDRVRADHIGMIFQVFNLVPWLGARDNVLLPCRYSARRKASAGPDPKASADRLLAELGLDDPALATAPARTLSVGQQQRVAAARALIGAPEVILADEPTSALDEAAKVRFITLLRAEAESAGAALLFVSHDRSLEPHFDASLDFEALNGGAA
ncbi:ABC transporter ATP-binding protein [Oceanomicrobium pacificus]|uniref:ATP-binding cassette domain-containing protein n=1 Tax=Oceanomicrobium pacificus TaxID=2692916 RepID=A0A6B0TVR6_9RHOB|nr:ABC transporter ATP-binding protein [Oceanomicrobium pacificus]MXU65083.1 ATP-binding cassette domain-containing protein [Oceanomicrobium pacificus]